MNIEELILCMETLVEYLLAMAKWFAITAVVLVVLALAIFGAIVIIRSLKGVKVNGRIR